MNPKYYLYKEALFVILITFAISPCILFAQKSTFSFSTSLLVGTQNFEQFPVKFGSGNHQFSNSLNALEIEVGREKRGNYIGSILQFSTSKTGPTYSNNFAFYEGNSFQLKYSRILLTKYKINVCPYLKLGSQNGTFIFSNDTNHAISAINAGLSNEIQMLVNNPKGSVGVQFRYKFSETNFISLFIEGSSGLFASKIRTTSNNIIADYTFIPKFFQVGISYTKGIVR
jgi:hypothetical protein